MLLLVFILYYLNSKIRLGDWLVVSIILLTCQWFYYIALSVPFRHDRNCASKLRRKVHRILCGTAIMWLVSWMWRGWLVSIIFVALFSGLLTFIQKHYDFIYETEDQPPQTTITSSWFPRPRAVKQEDDPTVREKGLQAATYAQQFLFLWNEWLLRPLSTRSLPKH